MSVVLAFIANVSMLVGAPQKVDVGYITPPKIVWVWAEKNPVDFYREFRGRKIYTEIYMDMIAKCETGRNPRHHAELKDGNSYRGAFGFWTRPDGVHGTWRAYGGHEFARSADRATYRQQKIVFMRVQLFGWRGVRAAGPMRNGCYKYAGPPTYIQH